MAVALDLVAQGADLLAMADITTFADIDISALKFQRRVWAHAVDLFDRAVDPEKRSDLDRATDSDHEDNADQQQDRIAFKYTVIHHAVSTAGAGTGADATASPLVTVFHKLNAISTVPAR